MDTIDNPEDLKRILEGLSPSSYLQTLDLDRPYDGQPWTSQGERGKQQVHGVSMRDIQDCYIRACYESSGLALVDYPASLYELPWDGMDPIAVIQNTLCNIEKKMGIFPNIKGSVGESDIPWFNLST
ncbi:hypothetical protein LCGC14_1776850 [marine sediment metagenome]|uniref:Uncharacterized protein n=1 Tax=marine sediment metagenome TaxID=412755 RepID=A0A0F9GWQ4_9ZZZZ